VTPSAPDFAALSHAVKYSLMKYLSGSWRGEFSSVDLIMAFVCSFASSNSGLMELVTVLEESTLVVVEVCMVVHWRLLGEVMKAFTALSVRTREVIVRENFMIR